MRTFIQFKDDVAFTTVQTIGEAEGIEVFSDNPEQFLKKKYIDGMWVDAPLIRYAILDDTNTIVQIEKTYFPSLVGDNIIIDDPSIKVNDVWNGVNFEPQTTFVESVRITEVPIVHEITQG
jgi:hypothetical protein